MTFEHGEYTVNENIGMFIIPVAKESGVVSEQVLEAVLGVSELGATDGE